jgi:tellurite methyltransferase
VTDGATWSDYYAQNEGREPRDRLLEVVSSYEEPGRAVDLGCGAGIDTLAMITLGWRVVAIDAENEAVERLRARVPSEIQDRLETHVGRMEEVELPPADLLLASFSLFFCDPGRFADVWRRIGTSLGGGGRFVGELLGERDTWAPDEDISAFTEAEARALFDGWTLERFDEEDEDGTACDGPKHWHVFHAVARAPVVDRLPDPPA